MSKLQQSSYKYLGNGLTHLMLILLIIFFSAKNSSLSQCCDAEQYTWDAQNIFGVNEIQPWHNYGYGLFLHILFALGIKTRLAVAIFQSIILIISAFYFTKVYSTHFQINFKFLYTLVLLFCLPISYGFSAFFLTEALVFPALFILFGLSVGLFENVAVKSKKDKYLLIIGIVTFIWMIRPALIWLPILFMALLTVKYDASKKLNRFVKGILVLAVITLPQYLLAKNTIMEFNKRPFADGVLHLNLAKAQSDWSLNYYRYATNLSGCGYPRLNFSPVDITGEQATTYTGDYSFIQKLYTYLQHIVSGWDALPGISYINHFTWLPWIFITFVSGFFICAPIILAYLLFSNKKYFSNIKKIPAYRLLIIFLVTQAVLINTATEFRFNIIGWFVCGVIWIYLYKNFRSIIRVRYILLLSISLSTIVLVLGQLALNASEIWQKCLN